MRRILLLLLLLVGVLVAADAALAGEAEQAPAVEAAQSIPPEAAGAEPGLDTSATCGSGGTCCGACQIRQKYAKTQADDGEGGCPCQRARRAREQAAREAAERSAAAAE